MKAKMYASNKIGKTLSPEYKILSEIEILIENFAYQAFVDIPQTFDSIENINQYNTEITELIIERIQQYSTKIYEELK